MGNALKYLHFILYHLRRRILWWQRWVVLVRAVDAGDKREAFAREYLLREAREEDYPAIIDAYPSEFSRHLPEALKRKQLLRRAKGAARCFVATDSSGNIVGGVWCSRYKNPAVTSANLDGEQLFELTNTFVIRSHRGKGLGGLLRQYAIGEMAGDGYTGVVSFVWYSRDSSLKMNFKTGSKLFAEKTLYSVMAHRWTRFKQHLSLKKLPLPAHPLIVVSGSEPNALKLMRLQFETYGLVVKAVLATDGASWARSMDKLLAAHKAEHHPPLLFCGDQGAIKAFYSWDDNNKSQVGLLHASWCQALAENNAGISWEAACGGKLEPESWWVSVVFGGESNGPGPTLVCQVATADAGGKRLGLRVMADMAVPCRIFSHLESLEWTGAALVAHDRPNGDGELIMLNEWFSPGNVVKALEQAGVSAAGVSYLEGIGQADLLAFRVIGNTVIELER